jgi:AbrB family looped-hinge helix DNA binding protein
MNAITVRLGPKYQIVIPKQVRDVLELRPDDSLMFIMQGTTVILRARPASFTDAMLGLHKELWEGVDPDKWLEEERSSWE